MQNDQKALVAALKQIAGCDAGFTGGEASALETARHIARQALSRTKRAPIVHVEIAHDGFAGDIIGRYETREGKRGVVVQQDGTRVVHVYGEKWIASSPLARQATRKG